MKKFEFATMSANFDKADSRNLPKVENVMILEYIATSSHHSVAEIRGAKMLMSSRDSYIDTAVGYVQVSRTGPNCIIKAKIVPEHRIGKKLYNVTCNIDEHEDTILDSTCEDCAASAAGCKHSLLLLFWLAKRTSEPSSTAVECYWNKPTLTSASTDPVLCKDIFPKAKIPKHMPKDKNVLQQFIRESVKRKMKNSLILNFSEGSQTSASKNIFDVMLAFVEEENVHSYENFKRYLQNIFNETIIREINDNTQGQNENKYWHSMRQGRLTASKLYEAAHCKSDGVLVQQILGGYKLPETKAIQRGQKLENGVLQLLKEKLNLSIDKSGFVLINGILGASPDGIGDDFVVEIKCPTSEKAVQTYIKNDNITEKFKAQIMCQMLACKKPRGLFCVADPLFETTKNIHVLWIDYNETYLNNLIKNAEQFWSEYVYPKILNSANQ